MPRPKSFLFVAFVASLLAHGSAAGFEQAELTAALDEVLDNDPTSRRTTVALKVIDIATGKVLYDRYGERLFTPASNLKIYTSACALDLFGPEQVFPTRVIAAVDENTRMISGDLKIIGGGNAMLSSEDLKTIADRIVNEWKVRSLRGRVVVDNSRYSYTRLGPGWMWDDQRYYFNMQITPLIVDFNAMTVPLEFEEDGDPVRVSMKDPPAWVAKRLTETLGASGVKVDPTQGDLPTVVERMLVFDGTKLAETLRHFNNKSENAVGEVLLHEIAIAGGIKRPSWPDGAREITKWLRNTARLEGGSFKLVDGSGLSRYNLISADSSVKLLAFMRRHQHYSTFFEALPAYDVDTGKGKSQKLVRAKSGGMSGVSTISGYAQTLEGRQLAFSLLGNGFIGSGKPVRDLRGKVWRVLVRYQKN